MTNTLNNPGTSSLDISEDGIDDNTGPILPKAVMDELNWAVSELLGMVCHYFLIGSEIRFTAPSLRSAAMSVITCRISEILSTSGLPVERLRLNEVGIDKSLQHVIGVRSGDITILPEVVQVTETYVVYALTVTKGQDRLVTYTACQKEGSSWTSMEAEQIVNEPKFLVYTVNGVVSALVDIHNERIKALVGVDYATTADAEAKLGTVVPVRYEQPVTGVSKEPVEERKTHDDIRHIFMALDTDKILSGSRDITTLQSKILTTIDSGLKGLMKGPTDGCCRPSSLLGLYRIGHFIVTVGKFETHPGSEGFNISITVVDGCDPYSVEYTIYVNTTLPKITVTSTSVRFT